MQGMHSLGAKGHSPGTADKAFTARGPMWARPRLRSRCPVTGVGDPVPAVVNHSRLLFVTKSKRYHQIELTEQVNSNQV